MNDPTQMAERHGRILTELAELGMSLARALHERAQTAETPKDAADLGLAFHRISRSVRQTLALEAKLERDRRGHEREDRDLAQRSRTARAEQRKAQVKFAVERCVWSEADGPEAERLLDELDDQLEEGALSDAFAGDEPIDAHIVRICAELGLATPPCGEGSGVGAQAPSLPSVHEGGPAMLAELTPPLPTLSPQVGEGHDPSASRRSSA